MTHAKKKPDVAKALFSLDICTRLTSSTPACRYKCKIYRQFYATPDDPPARWSCRYCGGDRCASPCPPTACPRIIVHLQPSRLHKLTPMTTFVNLVATRCKNGNHATLFRWHNDHVHILMGFDGLRRASLYRQAVEPKAGNAGAAPEYICLYDFARQPDFMAFEGSDARTQARQILLGGWGKEGIEITQRTQFWRLGTRMAYGTEGTVASAEHGGDGLWHVQSLRLGAGPAAGVARWLGDSLHRALDATTTGHLAWHRAVDAIDAGGDALVMAQTASVQAPASSPLPPSWWQCEKDSADLGAWGHAPATTSVAWEAPYRRLCVWGR